MRCYQDEEEEEEGEWAASARDIRAVRGMLSKHFRFCMADGSKVKVTQFVHSSATEQ